MYPESRTLGFCSQCQDITSDLKSVTNYSTRFSVGDSSYDVLITAFTANGIALANGHNSHEDTLYVVMNTTVLVDNFTSSSLISEPGMDLTFATFSFINIIDVSTVFSWPNSTLSATACSLCLCLQEVQSNITDGALVERVNIIQSTASFGENITTIYDPDKPSEVYSVLDAVVTRLQLFFYNFLPRIAIDILEQPDSHYKPDFSTNCVTFSGEPVFTNPEVEVIYN